MEGVAEQGAGCPPAERLVETSRGGLGRAEREEVFLHTTRCPGCAAAWRAAREMAGSHDTAALPIAKRGNLLPAWGRLAAAAATVVLLVLIGASLRYLYPDRETGPRFRTQQDQSLRSTLDEERALPREDFVLRWTAREEGTRYDVVVLSETLEVLTKENSLSRSEYRVPAVVLEDIPSGSRTLWQVTARLPDGRTVESETFFATVE